MQIKYLAVATAAVLALLAPCAPVQSVSAQSADLQTVDFSLAPAKGLKFKLTRTTTIGGTVTTRSGDEEMQGTQKGKIHEVYTQTYLDVKDGKVRKVERDYEEMTAEMTRQREGTEPRTRESESMLAWKVVRGEWDEKGKFNLLMKDDDTFEAAEEKYRKRVKTRQLLMPVVTLPKEEKKVGASWKFDGKAALLDLVAIPSERESRSPEFEGEGKITLTGLKEYQKLECAVLELEYELESEMRDEPGPSVKMKGTAYYSLEHRIVIAFDGKGAITMDNERQSGDIKIETKTRVKLVKKTDE